MSVLWARFPSVRNRRPHVKGQPTRSASLKSATTFVLEEPPPVPCGYEKLLLPTSVTLLHPPRREVGRVGEEETSEEGERGPEGAPPEVLPQRSRVHTESSLDLELHTSTTAYNDKLKKYTWTEAFTPPKLRRHVLLVIPSKILYGLVRGRGDLYGLGFRFLTLNYPDPAPDLWTPNIFKGSTKIPRRVRRRSDVSQPGRRQTHLPPRRVH